MSLKTKSLLLIIIILVVDQVVKFIVKTNMVLGDEFSVLGDWFRIHFLELETGSGYISSRITVWPSGWSGEAGQERRPSPYSGWQR